MSEKMNSYLDKKLREIDFESQRFKFWMETVPADLRRLEYDLWKKYRILHHINLYQHGHKQRIGRFETKPPYTPEQEKVDWKAFSHTFLVGGDRKKRFQDIVSQTESDLSHILDVYSERIQDDHADIVALTGSAVYGPRELGAKFSDIDLRFLFDVPTDELNVEIFPEEAFKQLGKPYHILGTGTADVSRGQYSDIHWLLLPHYPIRNRLSDTRVKELIADLVKATKVRIDELKTRLKFLDKIITERRKGLVIG